MHSCVLRSAIMPFCACAYIWQPDHTLFINFWQVSAGHAAAMQAIADYENDDDFGMPVGPLLQSLCVMVWAIFIMREIYSASTDLHMHS